MRRRERCTCRGVRKEGGMNWFAPNVERLHEQREQAAKQREEPHEKARTRLEVKWLKDDAAWASEEAALKGLAAGREVSR